MTTHLNLFFISLSGAAAARKSKSDEVFFGQEARMADSTRGMEVFTSNWSLPRNGGGGRIF